MSATPATVNAWLDELSSSILDGSKGNQKPHRKLQDAFRRRVKRHNFGRANQFEVGEHLDGLEEKFQILTLDHLSDALRSRRNELQEYEHLWLPDLLDLFLRLSGEPARNQKLLDLYRIPKRAGTPPVLTWKELMADDPVDKYDRLWRVPDFHDSDQSDYDQSELTSNDTPPQPVNSRPIIDDQDSLSPAISVLQLMSTDEHSAPSLRPVSIAEGQLLLSEQSYIKQVLLMLQGFSCDAFVQMQDTVVMRRGLVVSELTDSVLEMCSASFIEVWSCAKLLRDWTKEAGERIFIQSMKEHAELVYNEWRRRLGILESEMLNPISRIVISVSRYLSAVESASSAVRTVASLIECAAKADPVTVLDTLFDLTERAQYDGDKQAYLILSGLIAPSLRMYLLPVIQWMACGTLREQFEPFFIKQTEDDTNLTRLWQDKYRLQLTGIDKAPKFLLDTIPSILTCGKTAAFLTELGLSASSKLADVSARLDSLVAEVIGDFKQPFSATMAATWYQFVSTMLADQTELLKINLQSRCNMYQTLDNLDVVYLGRGGLVLDEFQQAVFQALDQDAASWNDHYRLSDILTDKLTLHGHHECLHAITIHSGRTVNSGSSADRASVRVLNAFAIQYRLSWPLANIIDDASLKIYRRVSLMIMRVSRAKYCLERIGYISVTSRALEDEATPEEQRFAQAISHHLLFVVDIVLDYLLNATIQPTMTQLQKTLREAKTIDIMIDTHKECMNRVDFSCLVSPRMSVLRQSLISILDLCIKFSDVVSAEKRSQTPNSTDDSGSFISARSRAQKFKAEQYGSDSDDSETARDGYSSFIVLDNEVSVFAEIKKVDLQVKKHLRFLIAGLEGASRAGPHVQPLQLLADRLSWSLHRP